MASLLCDDLSPAEPARLSDRFLWIFTWMQLLPSTISSRSIRKFLSKIVLSLIHKCLVLALGFGISRLLMGSFTTALADAMCLMPALSSIWVSGFLRRFFRRIDVMFWIWYTMRWLLASLITVIIFAFLEDVGAEILDLFSFIPRPSLTFIPGETGRSLRSILSSISSGMKTLLQFSVFATIFVVSGMVLEQIFTQIHSKYGSSFVGWVIRKLKLTPRLMPELSGLQVSKMQSYEYKALEGPKDIRLLILNPGRDVDEVSCDLLHISLQGNLKYEALSYVWGDPNNTRTITCSGGKIHITVNLYSALWHLRYRRRQRILWADALCINQRDVEERIQQVRVMADIYSQAAQVLVWLGEELEQVCKSFKTIKQAASFFPVSKSLGDYLDHADPHKSVMDDSPLLDAPHLRHQGDKNILDFDWQPIVYLISNPYFRRKWVIQEVAKGRRVTILCGDQELNWESLGSLVTHLALQRLTIFIPSFLAWSDTTVVSPVNLSMQNILEMHVVRGSKFQLVELLYASRGFECSHPNDHIISIIGLASDISAEDLGLLVDYNATPEELYKRVAVWSIFKKKSLLILSLTSSRHIASQDTLPSWVPDFSRLDMVAMLPSHDESVFAATGDSRLSAHLSNDNAVLHLSGKIIDSVHRLVPGVLPIMPSLSSEDRANSDKLDAYINFMALRWQEWFLKCRELAQSEEETMSPQRFEAFWRTLTGDLTPTLQRAPPEFSELFALYIERGMNEEDLDTESLAEFLSAGQQIEPLLDMNAGRRCFCSTSHGRFGLMPLSAEVGDILCVFYGGRVPYVIRPCGNGQYAFVGHCYVHGFMDGEAMEMKDIETEEFALR